MTSKAEHAKPAAGGQADTGDADAIVAWLSGPAREIDEPTAFIEALAERIKRAGVPLARMTNGVPLLHPQLLSSSTVWTEGKPAEMRRFRATQASIETLRNSPIYPIYQGGGPIRCRPADPDDRARYPIVEDLAAEGVTDYLVMPAPFSDGSTKAVTFATEHEDGFADADIVLFEAIIPALSMVLEIQSLRRTALTLLETYVGADAGRRVLDGQIRRGMGETIRAAIWLCDMRSFTKLSDRLPPDDLIAMLNDYFGAMSTAVEEHGGEVLKFIGDAMLAIFPLGDSDDAAASCARAFEAARAARASLETINAERESSGNELIGYGIALHVGDVLYGNIGGEKRLDFTVIGPAVNMAARIEGLCGELGRTLLMSEAFADAAALQGIAKIGDFELKGIARPQAVYGDA